MAAEENLYLVRFLIETPLTADADQTIASNGYLLNFRFTERDEDHVPVEVEILAATWDKAVRLGIDEIIPSVLDVLSFIKKTPMLLNIPSMVLKKEKGMVRKAIFTNLHNEK